MTQIQSFSFNFRGRNSTDEFGIRANSYDFILPDKRERRQLVPFRNGTYDYGAQWYNDRILRLRCIWLTSKIEKMTRSDIREIAYWLSKKGNIVLDIEPDKYYVGEINNANELIAHYNYAKEDIETGNTDTTDGEFELNFVCEPFAYGKLVTQPIEEGINRIQYKGTAETPCTIILRNETGFDVTGIQIVAKRRN